MTCRQPPQSGGLPRRKIAFTFFILRALFRHRLQRTGKLEAKNQRKSVPELFLTRYIDYNLTHFLQSLPLIFSPFI